MRSLYLPFALTTALAILPRPAPAGTETCATPDAAECAEDGDPCTVDHCEGGICLHDPVPDRVTCDPVLDAYRRTLGLRAFVAELAGLVPPGGLPDSPRFVIDGALAQTTADFETASRLLAGRGVDTVPTGIATTAQLRARLAFGILRASPARVRTLIRVFVSFRASLGPSVGDDLARRARFLYRSTTQLKRELRRLQRVSGVFAR